MHDKDSEPAHVFITIHLGNKYYWFESSWEQYKGLREYKSEEDIIKAVGKAMRDYYKDNTSDITYGTYDPQKDIPIGCTVSKYWRLFRNIETHIL